MNKPWKVVLAFAAIFLAGSIFGGLLTMRFSQHFGPKRGGPPPPISPGMLRIFADRLELTPEQKEKIRPMVELADKEMHRMRQVSLKDAGAVLRRLQQEFAKELTPEQRAKLEKMQVQQRERMREGREQRGDRPGGMPLLREHLNSGREGAASAIPPAEPKPEPVKP
jgi:Spy/CpxP family protein refolding chaperone